MKTFHLTVARVGENLFDGEVASVSLPGAEGVFEVLAGHEAFVSLLKAGEVHIRTENGEAYRFDIPKSGIAEVSHHQATILL
ncbi:MAG: FoF1 ATP synthase subunit delta/epsilon [Minisyncoccota bacterium]